VTVRPEDLRGAAADAYRMWRNIFGLSEQSALAAVQQDGLLPTTEHDQLAKMFREVFGMSEGAARVAADGRGGPPMRPVSEVAVRSSAGPQPGLQLLGKIERLGPTCAAATSLRRRPCGRRRLRYSGCA
jgi:hypothetical protein